jgi:HK97 family phage portal protein
MMGIFRNIFGRGRKEPEKREITGLDYIVRAVSESVKTPVSVRGDDALLVTAYKRALDVLSGSVARLPFQYMRRKGGIYEDWEDSIFHYLLTVQPQSRMSAFDWKFQMVWRAFHDGDAYIWPRFSSVDGSLMELVLLSRGACTYNELSGKYYVTDIYNNVYGTFGEEDILHIVFNADSNYHGIPLWELGRRALSILATGDTETLERFAKGGSVRGIVTNDKSGVRGIGDVQDEQMQKVARLTDGLFQNGERIVSIPGDVDFKQLSLNSTDMQFLETRKFGILEVSRLTGVPPIYLYDLAGSNYKMPEQADVAYLTQTLDRILSDIEGEFQRKLVNPDMCCRRVFRFDRSKLQSMDLNSWASYLGKLQALGALTVNETRQELNKPAVEHGDRVYVSTNLAELGSDKLGSVSTEE